MESTDLHSADEARSHLPLSATWTKAIERQLELAIIVREDLELKPTVLMQPSLPETNPSININQICGPSLNWQTCTFANSSYHSIGNDTQNAIHHSSRAYATMVDAGWVQQISACSCHSCFCCGMHCYMGRISGLHSLTPHCKSANGTMGLAIQIELCPSSSHP